MLRQAQHDYEILFSRLKKLFTPNKSSDLQGVASFLLILSWTVVITNPVQRKRSFFKSLENKRRKLILAHHFF